MNCQKILIKNSVKDKKIEKYRLSGCSEANINFIRASIVGELKNVKYSLGFSINWTWNHMYFIYNLTLKACKVQITEKLDQPNYLIFINSIREIPAEFSQKSSFLIKQNLKFVHVFIKKPFHL